MFSENMNLNTMKIRVRVCLIYGCKGVGKTSLTSAFTVSLFNPQKHTFSKKEKAEIRYEYDYVRNSKLSNEESFLLEIKFSR